MRKFVSRIEVEGAERLNDFKTTAMLDVFIERRVHDRPFGLVSAQFSSFLDERVVQRENLLALGTSPYETLHIIKAHS